MYKMIQKIPKLT